MSPLVRTLYARSEVGVPVELEAAGTALENPYVFDSVARELMSMAAAGWVEITHEHVRTELTPPLVTQLTFTRLK